MSKMIIASKHANGGVFNLPFIEPLEDRIAPASVTVNTLSDHDITGKTTLRDALANPSDTTINFSVHGSIKLASTLDITNSVTINGTGITLSGKGSFPDVSITGGATIGLNGLKITGGEAQYGGGVYINYGGVTVTLTKCTITGNKAVGLAGNAGANPNAYGDPADGGGIAILGGTVIINNSTISKNSATGGAGAAGGNNGGAAAGGGIFNMGTLTVINSHITGNTATGGAGTAGIKGIAYSPIVQGPVIPTVGGNGGNAYGGGISNQGGTLIVQGASVISGNTTKGGVAGNGGAAYNGLNGSNFKIINGAPYPATAGNNGSYGSNGGNGGSAGGGGISSAGGSVSITSSTISGNTVKPANGGIGTNGGKGGNGGNGGHFGGMTYAGYGGGSGGNGGNGGNAGASKGGGIFSTDTLTIMTSTISGNTISLAKAGTFGTGGAVGNAGSLYVNPGSGGPTAGTAGTPAAAAASYGGGAYSGGGTIAVTLATFAKNSSQNGGGLAVMQDTMASIYNSTIALNKATVSGGGIFITLDTDSDPVNAISCIIAQNTGSTTGTSNVFGTLGDLMDNVTTGVVVKTSLATHDQGDTQTLLPLASLATIANNMTTNPDGLLSDQDGFTPSPGANIEFGSVWKTS